MFFRRVTDVLKRDRRNEDGASAVEYGLLVAAIAAIIIVVVFTLGRYVQQTFSQTCTTFHDQLTAPASGSCT